MSGKNFTPVALYIGAAPSIFGGGQSSSASGNYADPLGTSDKFESSIHCNTGELHNSLLTLHKTIQAQTKTIENMKKIMETQNQTLLSHGSMLKSIAEKKSFQSGKSGGIPDAAELQLFPLDSLDALEAVENNLDYIPYDDLFSYIKGCIHNKLITKCISIFFTNEFLMSINWDGGQGKTALKKYKLFNVHILEAFQAENPKLSVKEFATEMKLGIKLAKNRYYKSLSLQRNSNVKAEKNVETNMEYESSNDSQN